MSSSLCFENVLTFKTLAVSKKTHVIHDDPRRTAAVCRMEHMRYQSASLTPGQGTCHYHLHFETNLAVIM